jgi:thiamine-phosphate pyrophosphorylase
MFERQRPATSPVRSRLRLLAIADLALLSPDRLVEQVTAAVEGGATAIQLRGKKSSAGELLAAADLLRAAKPLAEIPLFMNDRVDIAAMAGFSGVHLGDEDLTVADARKLLGPQAWIGRTARNPEAARLAANAGADYLGVGSVFGGGSKPEVPVIGIEGMATVVQASPLPVVAIGGVTAERAGACIAAGAAGVAVIGALFFGDPAPSVVRVRAAALRAAVEAGAEAR